MGNGWVLFRRAERLIPEHELFGQVLAFVEGFAIEWLALSELRVNLLQLIEKARRLTLEALEAIFFPLRSFVGVEAGRVAATLIV